MYNKSEQPNIYLQLEAFLNEKGYIVLEGEYANQQFDGDFTIKVKVRKYLKDKPYRSFLNEEWAFTGEEIYKEIVNQSRETKLNDLFYQNKPFFISPSLAETLASIKNFPYIHYGFEKEKLPSKVFFNDKKKATTLMYGDEATVVKCGKEDEYSRRVGFLEAYFQATCGMSKTQAKKYLENIVKDKG
jgi:hypothetical protein